MELVEDAFRVRHYDNMRIPARQQKNSGFIASITSQPWNNYIVIGPTFLNGKRQYTIFRFLNLF